jgi:hypothetical protein
MEKKTYKTPMMEVMNISVTGMIAQSDPANNVGGNAGFGYKGGDNPVGGGRSNRRRNSWDNTGW